MLNTDKLDWFPLNRVLVDGDGLISLLLLTGRRI